MAQSWEALRKEARRLETEIDTKLVDYCKVASTLQSVSTSVRATFETVRSTSEDEAIQRRPIHDRRDTATAEAMTNDMEALISKLAAVIEAMSSMHSSSIAGMGGSTVGLKGPGASAAAHTLQRHTEILHDYQQEFRKTRNSITTLNEHAELMSGANKKSSVNGIDTSSGGAGVGNSDVSSVDGGVSANGVAHNGLSGAGGSVGSGLDALYKERASISAATSGADTAISTGLSLKEDLDRQRAMFASMVERMETMSEGLPAVNRLIGQIRRKKKRDVLILGVVISTLLFITFSWKVMG